MTSVWSEGRWGVEVGCNLRGGGGTQDTVISVIWGEVGEHRTWSSVWCEGRWGMIWGEVGEHRTWSSVWGGGTQDMVISVIWGEWGHDISVIWGEVGEYTHTIHTCMYIHSHKHIHSHCSMGYTQIDFCPYCFTHPQTIYLSPDHQSQVLLHQDGWENFSGLSYRPPDNQASVSTHHNWGTLQTEKRNDVTLCTIIHMKLCYVLESFIWRRDYVIFTCTRHQWTVQVTQYPIPYHLAMWCVHFGLSLCVRACVRACMSCVCVCMSCVSHMSCVLCACVCDVCASVLCMCVSCTCVFLFIHEHSTHTVRTVCVCSVHGGGDMCRDENDCFMCVCDMRLCCHGTEVLAWWA